MNQDSIALLTEARMEADRRLTPQWTDLFAPLKNRRSPSPDRIFYTFALFDFELRLMLITYDQTPPLLGLNAALRPTGILTKGAALVKAPFETGWSAVGSEKIGTVLELADALSRLARQIEDQPQIMARRSQQMDHRF